MKKELSWKKYKVCFKIVMCVLLVTCFLSSCEQYSEEKIIETIQNSDHLVALANTGSEKNKFEKNKDVLQFLVGKKGTILWKCNQESDSLYYVTAQLVIPDGSGNFEFKFPCIIKDDKMRSWSEMYLNGVKRDNAYLSLMIQIVMLKRSMLTN